MPKFVLQPQVGTRLEQLEHDLVILLQRGHVQRTVSLLILKIYIRAVRDQYFHIGGTRPPDGEKQRSCRSKGISNCEQIGVASMLQRLLQPERIRLVRRQMKNCESTFVSNIWVCAVFQEILVGDLISFMK